MSDADYMSQEKFEELTEELQHRKTVTRKEVAGQLEYAKSLGDLSENFEYHDAKDRQAANEKRVLELDALLKNAIIVEKQEGGEAINIGATFTATKGGAEMTFQVVGSNEADPIEGRISNESPMGKAFLGAKVGDAVTVETPSGAVQYSVTSIM
ncbi:transcription elongation factor GreA [Candidatus Uhrbacteria bacterium]|jgi:transcription elongation factor GreA|nr:transcription elongation factor GreA [Candidatus Uhrbacteria bacterium]HJN85414.1 transcription elongation factor GreA [Patescibacteria group bacterium]